jgi:hypothetical protein
MAPSDALPRNRRLCYDGSCNHWGEVTEWFKVLASKASVRETVPWVRIPPSPPHNSIIFIPCSCRFFGRDRASRSTGVNLFPESPSSGGTKSANVIRDPHLDVRFG